MSMICRKDWERHVDGKKYWRREIKNYAIEKSDLNGRVSMESIEP